MKKERHTKGKIGKGTKSSCLTDIYSTNMIITFSFIHINIFFQMIKIGTNISLHLTTYILVVLYKTKVVSCTPSSAAMRDKVFKAHGGVERHFVIYCLEINCLLLKLPPCKDYGNSMTGKVIDDCKVALINCFVC